MFWQGSNTQKLAPESFHALVVCVDNCQTIETAQLNVYKTLGRSCKK